FDEFQQYFYLGGMALSLAGSATALLAGRLGRKKSASDLRQIDRLIELADKALFAQASSELNALEEELNKIIAWFVKGQASGTADSTAFSIAIAHAQHAIEKQRTVGPARANKPHASIRSRGASPSLQRRSDD